MFLTKIQTKNLFIYLLPVYISIICTCSTIFFCEAALLVFRAFCVGHAISAAAPGSRIMSSCPLSHVYLYIPVQMLRLLSKSVLRACSKAVGLCHIWIFVHREPAPELWIIFFLPAFLTSTSSAHAAVLTCPDSWTRRCDKRRCFHNPSWSWEHIF